MKWSTRLGASLLSVVLATAAHAAPADLVLINGKVVTVDDQFSVASAVAVRDGRILAVGDNEEILSLAGAQTRSVDLAGRTVIPGLIDTHSHLARASQWWIYEVRLDGVTSRAEAMRRLRERAAELQPGDWLITLGGWVEEQFLDAPVGFTLDELDQLAPNNPVLLDVNYSHRYVNSAFLELAGVPVINTEATGPAEDAGRSSLLGAGGKGLTEAMVDRDDNGRATGRIGGGGFAFSQILPLLPVLDEEQVRTGIKAAVADAVSNGLTTVYDGGGFGIRRSTYDRVAELAAEEELDMRIFNAWFMMSRNPEAARELLSQVGLEQPDYSNDRAAQIGLGELLYAPHLDGFDHAMQDNAENRAVLRDIFAAAAADQWNIQMHMVQPDTMNVALDLMDELSGDFALKPLRWIFIHADMIDAPALERMRPYNMSPSLRSNGLIGGAARQALLDKFGEDALAMPDLRMVQDSGIPWTFGSEAPRINVLNPMMSLAWAVTGRQFYDGKQVNSRTVSREEALIAHTRNGAYSVFQENSLGQIRPGFLADMVVLDRDYLSVPGAELYDVRAVLTVVNGKVVFDAGAQ